MEVVKALDLLCRGRKVYRQNWHIKSDYKEDYIILLNPHIANCSVVNSYNDKMLSVNKDGTFSNYDNFGFELNYNCVDDWGYYYNNEKDIRPPEINSEGCFILNDNIKQDKNIIHYYKAMKELLVNNKKISRVKWSSGINMIYLELTDYDRIKRIIINKNSPMNMLIEDYSPKHDDIVSKDWYVYERKDDIVE